MKVGDLVKCPTVREGATGIVVEFFKVSGLWGVILSHNGAMCCFQRQHLEVISESR
jgi:hypothetical protein